MKIETSEIMQLTITDVSDLDPIRVMIEDTRPGAGRITLSCYRESWSAEWGAMGNTHKVADFFCFCDPHYLIKNIAGHIPQMVFSSEEALKKSKKAILARRRGLQFDCSVLDILDKKEARELWDEVEDSNIENAERWEDLPSRLMEKLYGDEWWFAANAEAPNGKYQYLTRIIQTVQDALKQQNCKAAA